jgi:hypothetical protein
MREKEARRLTVCFTASPVSTTSTAIFLIALSPSSPLLHPRRPSSLDASARTLKKSSRTAASEKLMKLASDVISRDILDAIISTLLLSNNGDFSARCEHNAGTYSARIHQEKHLFIFLFSIFL